MLDKQELRKFYKSVEIIDEFFDINRFDTDKMDKVISLGEQFNLEGINVLLNKNDLDTAEELLMELFKIEIKEINENSQKYGYYKIN